MFAMRELGLPVEIKEDGSRYALREERSELLDHQSAKSINPVCFEVPSTYEITVNGKKLIGSAQARKKEGVLQHGSLPLTGDLTRICQALIFKDEAAREVAAQRLLTRATTVESILGVEGIRPDRSRRTPAIHTSTALSADWETAAQAFVHGFEAQLGIHFQRGELSRSESERAEELVKEKYANPSWTEKS
jgi:lipoate-protein ligase A